MDIVLDTIMTLFNKVALFITGEIFQNSAPSVNLVLYVLNRCTKPFLGGGTNGANKMITKDEANHDVA